MVPDIRVEHKSSEIWAWMGNGNMSNKVEIKMAVGVP